MTVGWTKTGQAGQKQTPLPNVHRYVGMARMLLLVALGTTTNTFYFQTQLVSYYLGQHSLFIPHTNIPQDNMNIPDVTIKLKAKSRFFIFVLSGCLFTVCLRDYFCFFSLSVRLSVSLTPCPVSTLHLCSFLCDSCAVMAVFMQLPWHQTTPSRFTLIQFKTS